MKQAVAAFVMVRGHNYAPTVGVRIGKLMTSQRLLASNSRMIEQPYWSYLDGTPTYSLPGRVSLPSAYCRQAIFNPQSLHEIEEI